MNARTAATAFVLLGLLAVVVAVPTASALSSRLGKMQQCQVSCTADGGAANELWDCVDGGSLMRTGDSVRVVNPSTTPVHVGPRSSNGASRALNVNNGAEICSGCDEGAVWAPDSAADGLGCTSEGAAVNVRVMVGAQ